METTTPKFFRVGGCVRDALLGIESKDIDFAVEAESFEAMAEAVKARCTKVFTDNDGRFIGQEFFTIRGIDPVLGAVDFVLCRKDGPSADGRRPDFVEAGTILDDLARRDFTVNAIAEQEDGTLLDPFGGAADVNGKTLRFVGFAEDRLAEDALRAFRGVRFQITKGFRLDSAARAAIRNMEADRFDAVSTERIREEMLRCFAKDTAASLRTFCVEFPNLLDLALARGLWFLPTTKEV